MDLNTHRAFTLVELMVVLALVAIIASLAAPSLAQMHGKQQLGSFQDDLLHLIVQARQHALVNRSRVTLCALDSQDRCISLKTGVLTSFVDANGNRALDPGELRLRTLAIPAHMNVDWVGMKPIHSLHFSAQGNTFLSSGSFTLCHQAGLGRYGKLTINPQGRVRAERHAQDCPLDQG